MPYHKDNHDREVLGEAMRTGFTGKRYIPEYGYTMKFVNGFAISFVKD